MTLHPDVIFLDLPDFFEEVLVTLLHLEKHSLFKEVYYPEMLKLSIKITQMGLA